MPHEPRSIMKQSRAKAGARAKKREGRRAGRKNRLPAALQEEFLRDLQFSRRRSERTVEAYRRDLQLYAAFCGESDSLEGFCRFLTKKGLSARSQARAASCVRSYFRFLLMRGRSAPDIKRLKPPRIKSRLPKSINLREFQALFAAACQGKNQARSLRNQLALSFLYGLGCRVSELTALNIQDFHPAESWIKITGKGDRQRLLPLSQELAKLLAVYLAAARPLGLRPGSPALLFNNRGRRPSRSDIWRWLKAWSEKAGFSEVKNPHSFRHGCAAGLLENGADLRSIQKLLGHLSLQTTQIYTAVNARRLKETVDQFHPLR